MSRRSRAREVVLQILYQDDLNPGRMLSNDEEFIARRLQRNSGLIDFAQDLIAGVRRNRPELDELLGQRTKNWSLARMAATDRNVLRLGAYEILYAETPDRVAVNEAVELAKRYGSKQSAQFVNGILDRLMHDDRNKMKSGNNPTSTVESHGEADANATDADGTESDDNNSNEAS